MHIPRSVLNILMLLVPLVCCLWPAIYNGGPLLDSDMPTYIRYADIAVAKIAKRPSEWSQPHSANQSAPAASAPAGDDGEPSQKTAFLGRSIYYGMLLKLGDATDMMWPSIALQAAALLLAIALTLRNTIGFNPLVFGVTVALLAFTTPMAFHASRLMPDMFAGIAILATGNLIIYGGRMSPASLFAWTGLLSAALLCHSTHVLVTLSLFALYLIGRLFFRGPASWAGFAGVLLSILIAFAGDALFVAATTRASGVAPIRPPFLTARLVLDGPGEAYLRQTCPGSGFVMCRFVDRPPAANTDAFLWSSDPAEGGVFSPADPDTRRALSAEQFRFALAVLRYDPLGEVTAMAKNTLVQIGKVSVFDFNLNDIDRQGFRRDLPARYLEAAEKTRSWRGTMPATPISVMIFVSLFAGTAYILWVLLQRDRRSADSDGLDRLAVAVIIGILLNAFVCGAMSEPDYRYQSRVVWLIPFLAGLLYRQRSLRLKFARQAELPPVDLEDANGAVKIGTGGEGFLNRRLSKGFSWPC